MEYFNGQAKRTNEIKEVMIKYIESEGYRFKGKRLVDPWEGELEIVRLSSEVIFPDRSVHRMEISSTGNVWILFDGDKNEKLEHEGRRLSAGLTAKLLGEKSKRKQ